MLFKSIKRYLVKKNIFYTLPAFLMPYNKTVSDQHEDYKAIPIIIISFNQLFYLRKLIDFLRQKGYSNIVILDNKSDYQPLLDYFVEIQNTVTIHRLQKNYGHRVFWKRKDIYDIYRKGYFVVTDPDIVPLPDCPEDFLQHFKEILDKNMFVKKVGFSLDLDDIPMTHPHREKVIEWEQQFWQDKDADGNYIAIIDTTFALYRPETPLFRYTNFFRGIRTKKPYTAIHGGWHIDINNMTEEQKHYYKVANSSCTWKINENGNLVCDMYTRDKNQIIDK